MKPNSFDWKQLCAQFGDYVESLHREISSLKTALAFETELRKSLEEEINKAKAERRLTGADTKSNAAEDTEEEDVSTTEEEEEEDENDKADNIPLSRVASSVSSGSVARISAKTLPNSDDSETSMDENAPLSSIHRTATPITPRQTSKTVDNSVLASDSDSDSEGEKKLQARSLEEMILLRETQIPLTPVAANKTNKHLPQPRKARQQQPSKPIIEDDDGTTIRGHKRKTLPAFDCPDCEKFYKLHGPVKLPSGAPKWNDENSPLKNNNHICQKSAPQQLLQRVGRHRRRVPRTVPNSFWESDFVD